MSRAPTQTPSRSQVAPDVPTAGPASPSTIRLRPATAEDARLLWLWRNDPATRANSFHSEPVPWETHARWLQTKLASSDCRLWLLEEGGTPVGQIRYDREGPEAHVSFSVAAEARGRGYGTALLRLSVPRACAALRVSTVVAYVHQDNLPSRRAFESAGFSVARSEVRQGKTSVRFERTCDSAEVS